MKKLFIIFAAAALCVVTALAQEGTTSWTVTIDPNGGIDTTPGQPLTFNVVGGEDIVIPTERFYIPGKTIDYIIATIGGQDYLWAGSIPPGFPESTALAPDYPKANGITKVKFYWRDKTFTVKFDKNNSDAEGTMADQVVNCGATNPLNNCTFSYPGHTFIGWAMSSNATQPDFYPGETTKLYDKVAEGATQQLYALWHANTYFIWYVDDTDSIALTNCNPQTEQIRADYFKLRHGTNLFSRAGYTFGGWRDRNNGVNRAAEENVEATTFAREHNALATRSNVNLYPIWTANKYTLHFDTGAGVPIGDQQLDYDGSFTLPAATRDYYHLLNWQINGQTYAAGTSISKLTTDKEITAIAQWEQNSNTVHFVQGEDETLNVSDKVIYGNTELNPVMWTEPKEGITHAKGYAFDYWTNETYNVGTKDNIFKPTDFEIMKTLNATTIEFRAVWAESSCTLIFKETKESATTLATVTLKGSEEYTEAGITNENWQCITEGYTDCTLPKDEAIKAKEGWPNGIELTFIKKNVVLHSNGSPDEVFSPKLETGSYNLAIPEGWGTGLKFCGWDTKPTPDGTGKHYDATSISADAAPITLYAQWTTKTGNIEVKFIEDGSPTTIKTISVTDVYVLPNTYISYGLENNPGDYNNTLYPGDVIYAKDFEEFIKLTPNK